MLMRSARQGQSPGGARGDLEMKRRHRALTAQTIVEDRLNAVQEYYMRVSGS